MIRFVVKSAFWLFVILVGLTFFVPMPDRENGQDYHYSSMDALFAVRSAVADLGGFCSRNEETCHTGKSLISSLGMRARDGAGMLYQFLDRQFTFEEAPQTDTPPK